jgi:small GTP-binding protein
MSEQENPTKIISISLYGESDVGKTCICYSFLGLEFLDEHLSTVGIEKNNAEIEIESGETVKLKIWDTAGQERFRSISFNSLRKSNGCIVVFDLTEKSSFEKVTEWLKKIREKMPKIPIALFGNKNDLPNRKVTQEEIDELCKRENLIYFETSAKENKGIKEGFIKISTLACENLGKEDSVERGQNLKKDNKNKKKKKCC